MEIKLLVVQRKERYAGEHSPEILAVADENVLDDNPEWWDDEIKSQLEAIGESDIDAWTVITATIPTEALHAALYPQNRVDLTITEG